jgi:gliding motility-associated-like protein
MILYSYFTIPGAGAAGPYQLMSWEVGDDEFSMTTFMDLDELVIQMNVWDPNGDWKMDASAMTIVGGSPSNHYGDLYVVQINSGDMSIAEMNEAIMPGTTALALSEGEHELLISKGSCVDAITIEVVCEDDGTPPVIDDTDVSITAGSLLRLPISKHIGREAIDEVYIVDGPLQGGVEIDQKSMELIYTPNEDFCGFTDRFSYMINYAGFATRLAEVNVDVHCAELIVYSGFSPNNDGLNDTWKIQGIENYPENKVMIFDALGNRVYYDTHYTNEKAWDGLSNGVMVPSGTYYYVIRDGEGKRYTGFIQINR